MTEAPKTTLTDGSPVTPDHREIQPNGQQKGYVVLSADERAKGFVRPFRDAYRHVGAKPIYPVRPLRTGESAKYEVAVGTVYEEYPPEMEPAKGRYWEPEDIQPGCGAITTMSRSIAETYARDPTFYSGTFCSTCRKHFPVGRQGQFTWYEMDGREGPKVGT